MQSVISILNRFFERAPSLLLPMRWLIIAVFMLVSGVMFLGMYKHFAVDMSLESWFQDNDPIKVSLDRFRKQFGSDDGVYIVYRAKDGDVFSEQSLQVIRDFHLELDAARLKANQIVLAETHVSNDNKHSTVGLLSRIERIDSLYNARYQIADGDTLITKKLVGAEFPSTDIERERRRTIAEGQDSFELTYYSKDFQFGGIRLKTDFGTVPIESEADDHLAEEDLLSDDDYLSVTNGDGIGVDFDVEVEDIKYRAMEMDEYLYFMTELRTITEKPEYAHFHFYYTGNAPMMEFAMQNLEQASILLFLMVVVVVGLLWVLFRSFSAVLWPIFVIAASGLWTVGMGCWIGITFSTMVVLTFMLVLAVGVADCVHVLSAYTFFRRENHEHRKAMALAYRKTGVPIFLTTITTMAGMLALLLSDIPQIVVFGLTSALAVLMAFVLTVFVLPVMLDLWHPFSDKNGNARTAGRNVSIRSTREKNTREKTKHLLQPLLDKLPLFTARYSKSIVMSYIGLFALLVFGATQVRVDSNIAELAKEGSTIQITYELVDKHMMGGQNMEFMLDFGKEDALKDPQVLTRIEALQRHVESTYPEFVVKTFSLADFVKDTNKVMHEDREEYSRIPSDPKLTAQLLYLFDNANPSDRRNVVSDDYRQTHLTMQLRNKGTYEYTAFFDDVQRDVERIFDPLNPHYPEMSVNATGSLTLMMELINHISWTQIKSFSFALLIITLLMMVSLGSIQAGFISMIPNLLPAIFTFGMMGLVDVPLDTDTLIIAPLIIGIAVDDTIHFLAHYKDAWYEKGDVDAALRSTIQEVGLAVTFTTLILGVGFSVLAFSDYLGLSKPGMFGSAAIFVALSSDLLFLPALIKWLKPDLGRTRYLANQTLSSAKSTI